MHGPSELKILGLVNDRDLVLDIGGWARPFNRANYVIDAEPYETRGYFSDPKLASKRGWFAPAQGGAREWFCKETWIQRDLCDKTPFPFKDKEIDFVICSHTLEDIRDPLWVCAEIVRVGKRGYIEVPSRLAESCRGIEPNLVGWSHHRWLVDIADSHVSFLMKYHTIHSHWRFSFPPRYLKRLPEDRRVQWLYWEEEFTYSELNIHSPVAIAAELEKFAIEHEGHPRWVLAADHRLRSVRAFTSQVARFLRRRLAAS